MFEIEVPVVVETKMQPSNIQAGRITLERNTGFGVVEMEDSANPGNFIQAASTQLSSEAVEKIFVATESIIAEDLAKQNPMFWKVKRVESVGRIIEIESEKE